MSMDTQRSGQWYIPGSDDANAQHAATFALTREFNALVNTDPAKAKDLLSRMFSPTSATPEIWAPLHLEYGVNTTFGDGCFMNFNYVILDIVTITIGDNYVIAAGAVITKDIPSDTFAGGVPARMIRSSSKASCLSTSSGTIMPTKRGVSRAPTAGLGHGEGRNPWQR